MSIKRFSSQDEFDGWLIAIPEIMKEWIQGLPIQISSKLDYSLDSLTVLEAWLLENFEKRDDKLPEGLFLIAEPAGYYVGEIVRKLVGGEWVIELTDKEYAYLGIPGIYGDNYFSNGPVYPVTWITTCVARRTGHYLSDRVNQQLKEKND